ncbi:MAG: amino acid permease [Gemmatimonadetes bacterium]|nr:amino acid permease [Gemmatimonadota bacterium]
MAESQGAYRRSIGPWRASAIVAGTIIGASIFVQPTAIIAAVRDPFTALGVWLVAGGLTLIGALVVAELSSAMPATGGVYVFLSRAFSPGFGFLWGWAMFWSMHTGIAAAIAMVVARYLGTFVTLGDGATKGVAIAAVVGLTAVNYFGVRYGGAVQAALTAVKVVALVGIIAMIFLLGDPAPAAATPAPPVTVDGVLVALVAGLFAYGGWHMVSYTAEETVDPTRTIPRALLIGTTTVTALYVLVNAAYLYVLPADAVAASTRVAADAAEQVMGPGASRVVAALVIVSALGALNGVILGGPRVYQAMAADGLMFKAVAVLHPRYGTPHRALVLQAAAATVLIATATYGKLFTRVIYTEWIFFAMLAIAVLVLRKRAGYSPRYRMPAAVPLVSLFVLGSVAIVVNQVVRDPRESAIGLGIVAVGWFAYIAQARKRARPGSEPGRSA